MMDEGSRSRRAFLRDLGQVSAGAAAFALLNGCTSATPAASQAPRVYRVGLLGPRSESTDEVEGLFDLTIERLGELGYARGQNLVIEQRSFLDGAREDTNRAAAELVGLPVDVLVVRSGPAIGAAMAATSSIPIVMLGTPDPVGFGYVESLARPGGNVTGVTGAPPEVELKRLQLLVEAVPGVSRVAVIGLPGTDAFWAPAVRSLGIELIREPVAPGGFEPTLARVTQTADAVFVRQGQATNSNATLIGALAARFRLPGMFPARTFVEAGGLMTYEARLSDLQRRTADYVDRILRGVRPPDLPVEQPLRYDLVVNMTTARALGLTFNPTFLAQVDEIIE